MAGDLRPVGGRDYPRTYQEFRSWFTEEWACREYLAELRWRHGFWCPDRGSGDCCRTGTGLWMCAGCGLRTSVTAAEITRRTASRTPLQPRSTHRSKLSRMLSCSSCSLPLRVIYRMPNDQRLRVPSELGLCSLQELGCVRYRLWEVISGRGVVVIDHDSARGVVVAPVFAVQSEQRRRDNRSSGRSFDLSFNSGLIP